MNRRSRTMAAVLAVLATVTVSEGIVTVAPSGSAQAGVCVSVGRRVSVGGCTHVADTIARYAPPPEAYAPLPEDYPPPPPAP